jgi:hypothetical protein
MSQERELENAEKEYRCETMDCFCWNCKDDIDFPLVEFVKDWRNCLLCLLTELLQEIREMNQKLGELSQ